MANVFEKSKKVLYYGAYWRKLKVAIKNSRFDGGTWRSVRCLDESDSTETLVIWGFCTARNHECWRRVYARCWKISGAPN